LTSPALRSVVVIGASLAGHATARALRRQGFDGRITVVGDETERPYDRPPLSKEFLAGRATEDDLALETPSEDLHAEWLLGSPAVALDVASRTVTLADDDRVSGDAVVIATGSRARAMPGSPAGVHTLRTMADARALRAELRPGARLVVIGAGFIGAEVASTASALGLDVTVLEAAPSPLAGPLGVEIGGAVAALHERNGVLLRCGIPVAELTGSDRVTGVRLADGTFVPADLVVAGIGAVPAVDWLAKSGLDISAGLVCSATGRTGAPGIYGVGDCSAWFDPLRGYAVRVEHWTDSRDRPVALVADLLGAEVAAPMRAPYFWSDQYGVRIQFAGRRSAGAGPGDEEVEIEAGSAAGSDLLAVYRQHGEPVAVLGMNQPKLFIRWRKALSAPQPAHTY
jgi:NADPH-dependent 2,4-dienoyl-CoA reductase/sulfur reductase-like enzyme